MVYVLHSEITLIEGDTEIYCRGRHVSRGCAGRRGGGR